MTEASVIAALMDLLFRHFTRVAMVMAVTVAVALLYNAVHGPSYTASVRVLVTPSAGAGSAVSDLQESGATLVVADHGQTARNQAELLNDHGLIARFLPAESFAPTRSGLLPRLAFTASDRWRRMAVRLGLASPASQEELTASRMTRAVAARAVGDTDVMQLDFTWSDRFFAASAINQVLAGYQRAIATSAEARESFRQAQLRLAEAEADASGSAGQGGEQAADLDRERAAMQIRVDDAHRDADRLRLERELARRKLDATEQSFHSGGWVDGAAEAGAPSDLAANFASLLKERQDLLLEIKPNRREVRRLDAEISEVRQQNYRAVRLFAQGQIDILSEHLQTTEDGIARDGAALRRLDAQVAEAALVAQTRAARLVRVTETKRRAREAAVRVDAVWQEVGATRVLSEAGVPAEADFPAPPLLVVASIWLGAVLGMGSAMLAERRRRTIDRPDDIARHLGIEVLARLGDVPPAQTAVAQIR